MIKKLTKDYELSLKILLGFIIFWIFLSASGPIQWMDNGMFLSNANTGDLFSKSSDDLSHPFFHFTSVLISRIFGNYALSYLNVFLLIPLSYLIYKLCLNLGTDKKLALICAASSLLIHSIFWISTKVEVYLLNTLLLVWIFYIYYQLILDKNKKVGFYLFCIGLLTGLAACTHQITFIVLLPVYIHSLFIYRSKLIFCIPGFLVGIFSAYPGIFNEINEGMNAFEIGRAFFTGHKNYVANSGFESKFLKFSSIITEKNSVLILIFSLVGTQIAGLLFFPKTIKKRLLYVSGLLNFLFAVSYNVNDRFTFFLTGAVFSTILGCIWLYQKTSKYNLVLASAFISPILLISVYILTSTNIVKLPKHKAPLPYRNDIKYFMVPYLKDNSAELFVNDYEKVVPKNQNVICDWTPTWALISAQAIGKFKDRKIIDCQEKISENISTLYLVRLNYCENLQKDFKLQKEKIGYKLEKRETNEKINVKDLLK